MNNIKIPRGTTMVFDVDIYDESTGKKFEPSNNTKVIFGVKRNPDDTDYLIQKNLKYQSSVNNYKLELVPGDTSNLPYGRYWYDIGLSDGEDYFVQIFPTSVFMISPSVTTNPAQGV